MIIVMPDFPDSFNFFKSTFTIGCPCFTLSLSDTRGVKQLSCRSTVLMPMCINISIPSLPLIPNACPSGKAVTTSPATGEMMNSSCRSIANPSPNIFFAKVSSGTFSSGTNVPLAGAMK